MGALEQALFASTVPLIEANLLLNFRRAFKAWKVPDEINLTKRIKHALVALYQRLKHLSPDEPEDSELKKAGITTAASHVFKSSLQAPADGRHGRAQGP